MTIKATRSQAVSRGSDALDSLSGSNVMDTPGTPPRPRAGGMSRQATMPEDQTAAALTSYHVGGAVFDARPARRDQVTQDGPDGPDAYGRSGRGAEDQDQGAITGPDRSYGGYSMEGSAGDSATGADD
jgi:hypothetical protein